MHLITYSVTTYFHIYLLRTHNPLPTYLPSICISTYLVNHQFSFFFFFLHTCPDLSLTGLVTKGKFWPQKKSLACRLQRKLASKSEETLLLSYGLLQDPHTCQKSSVTRSLVMVGQWNYLPNNSKYVTTLTLCWISFLKRQKQTKLDLVSPSFSTSLSLKKKPTTILRKP